MLSELRNCFIKRISTEELTILHTIAPHEIVLIKSTIYVLYIMRSNWSSELISKIKLLYVNGQSASMVTHTLNDEGNPINNYQVRHIIRKLQITRTQSDAAKLRTTRQGHWLQYRSKPCPFCGKQYQPTGAGQRFCLKCNRNGILVHYGITADDYDQMVKDQLNSCEICKVDFCSLPTTSVHLDHDHKTGSVRGILCAGCNWKIAIIDDIDWHRCALNYVAKPGLIFKYVEKRAYKMKPM